MGKREVGFPPVVLAASDSEARDRGGDVATVAAVSLAYSAARKNGSTVPLILMIIGFPRRSLAVGTSTRTQPSATLYS